jgi:hypothetical protein
MVFIFTAPLPNPFSFVGKLTIEYHSTKGFIMDWKKTFNQGQWIIHGIFVVAILIGIGSTLFTFRLSHLQSTEDERMLKVNGLIKDLRSDDSFAKISKYLSWAESDKAHDKIRKLTQQIAETEEMLELKASDDLRLALRTFNKLINNNSGMSDPSDALKVLKQKVNALNDVAESQKYKNVALISGKMKERLGSLTSKNVGGSIQISHLKTDIKRLENLINNSSLTDGEKNSLKNRFESMKNELEMLGSLNSQSRNLRAHETQASLALTGWLLEIEKRASNLKGMRQQKQNQLIIILASLVAFLVLSWIGLAYLFRWQRQKISFHMENEVKSVIEKGILGDQRFMVDHYSDETREDIIRLLDELKVKLNLGTLLHEGLPFAGCMIDYNFKLTWYNNLFLDQLYLSEEEVRSDAFNWDYVRDYLNLDEDPIYQAMVNKIAGIYPVKVKQDELAPSQPYEMYVTPISANREGRVMVFFYPLVSVKDAIREQVDLSKQTIARFVSLWNAGGLTEDELRLMEKNFKNNDLEDLYADLQGAHNRIESEKTECLHTIHSLEKENQELNDTISDYREIEEKKRSIVKEEIRAANELRDSFITSLEKAESLLQINKTVLQMNDDFKTEAQRLQTITLDAIKKGKESMDILTQLDGVKTDYKKLKFELMEVKAKLISLNNSLLAQLPPLDENQQKLALRYKDELARLDFNVSTLDKKLSQLDMLLAKLNMIHEKNPAEQTTFSFQTTQKDHEIREAIIDIQKTLTNEESKILTQFKTLHGLMKKEFQTTPRSSSMEGENFLS